MIHQATTTVKFRRLSRSLAALYGCSRIMADTLAVGHLPGIRVIPVAELVGALS